MIRKFLFGLLIVTIFAATMASAGESYLARGTWYFTGSGTGTVNGYSFKADVTNGKAVIESTGEAGDEYVTHVKDSYTAHVTGPGVSETETLKEEASLNYHDTNNTLSYSNDGLTWVATQTSATTAKITCSGTTTISGYRVSDFNMNYNASTEAPAASDGGGGCSVGAFSPLLSLLMVPLFLLRK